MRYKLTKRIIAIVLSFVMAVSVFPQMVNAQETAEVKTTPESVFDSFEKIENANYIYIDNK